MKNHIRSTCFIAASTLVISALHPWAQDWPQWRGANRDAKAAFTAPKEWPKALANKWTAAVGQGDAAPALVGDKLYVFARQEGREVTLCLDASNGKELWKDPGYDALPPNGPSSRHPGPRSSPCVADGKVITFGVRGTLSCLDASSGKMLWRKDDFAGAFPRFFTASSPLCADGLCIAQCGGEEKGGMVAYALATGEEKWKWTDDGSTYASPVLLDAEGKKQVVAVTPKKLVGLDLASGKLLWEVPFAPQGRMGYNAATPIVDGSTVYFAGSGRGIRAAKIEKQGDAYVAKGLWTNAVNSVQFDTPVLKNGMIFGLSQKGDLFCIDAKEGNTLWTAPGVGGQDFGSVIDAGAVMIAKAPKSDLIVFQPNGKEFQKVASYKVAETDVYAYPVLSKARIFVKDQEGVTLWTVD